MNTSYKNKNFLQIKGNPAYILKTPLYVLIKNG